MRDLKNRLRSHLNCINDDNFNEFHCRMWLHDMNLQGSKNVSCLISLEHESVQEQLACNIYDTEKHMIIFEYFHSNRGSAHLKHRYHNNLKKLYVYA